MEFNQKLQELRKQKGLTQEELANALFVSRTAISKWESGRGYPNIDSIKAIAKFFHITVDELLSTDEVLIIAEEDSKRRTSRFRDIVYGLIDLSLVLLFFLPFFRLDIDGKIQSTSLLALDGVKPYLKIAYFSIVILTTIIGVLTLALQSSQSRLWHKYKGIISLVINVLSVLLFIISLQPYPAVYLLALLTIKVSTLLKAQ